MIEASLVDAAGHCYEKPKPLRDPLGNNRYLCGFSSERLVYARCDSPGLSGTCSEVHARAIAR